jgi:hemin uptake protein HemP
MQSSPSSPAPALAPSPKRLTSDELMGKAREIVIAHNGREYRLRLTQNGKLILTA